MKERGIIFNAEMVRAILDGRKTMTRRVMKVQPSPDFSPMNMGLETDFTARWYTPGVVDKHGYLQPAKKQVFGVASEDEGYTCPFGAVGDRLWVRETWAEAGASAPDLKLYRANYPEHVPAHYENVPPAEEIRWTPSIHMPRWASRITLEITGVRVERLASISDEDAGKEGYPANPAPFGGRLDKWLWFRQLWDGIYPEQSFKHNPWVWVVEFRVIENRT